MPPRKSTDSSVLAASTPAPPTNGDTSTLTPTPKTSRNSAANANANALGIEDLSLPRSMIQRLAKGVLPSNTQVQKDAVLALSKSATVFVSYLVNSANDRAVLANKKTVQPKDVLEALGELEFEGFVERVEAELLKYNTMQCTKRNEYRRRIREEAKGADGSMAAGSEADALDTSVTASMLANMANGGVEDVSMTNGHDRDHDGEPTAKKIRIGSNGASGLAREDADETEEDGNGEAEEDMDEEPEEDDEQDDVEDEVEEQDGEDVEDRLEEDDGRHNGLDDEESGNDSD